MASKMIYRKIYRRMWGDAKFRSLSPMPPSGQGLWLWLLTGPFTEVIPGVLSVGEMAMAERLRWPVKGFREAFREVSGKGLVKADFEAPLLWIPNAIHYNGPANPNVVKSWEQAWDALPECELKLQCFRALEDFLEGKSKGFREAFREVCRKPLLNASANQEQEQEQDIETPIGVSCSERPEDRASEPVLDFETIGKGEQTWALTEDLLAVLAEAYPDLDILAEAKKAKAWLIANPHRRKTPRGMPSFLRGWVERAQNSGKGVRRSKPTLYAVPSPEHDHYDEARKWISSYVTDPERRDHYLVRVAEAEEAGTPAEEARVEILRDAAREVAAR